MKMPIPPEFEIIVGTYEEYLLGYKINEITKGFELKQSFATHEHSSSLRAVTSSGKYVASGGADDRICIYDMFLRKEHVMLTEHNSTISCLEFTTGSTHLVSSSNDGHLAITRVGNWVVEKIWEKAHKNGYVIALGIHPTGKLALTLGSDCTLQTWNLIKGRKAYIINLNSKSTDAKSLNFIKWGSCGEKFLLGGGNNIEIWSISQGGILNKFTYNSKVICATWITEDIIAIGHEDGKLTTVNITEDKSKEYEAHSTRLKCLEYNKNYLVTCSSSGVIKLWSVSKMHLTELAEINSGCRITCVALVDGVKVKKEEVIELAEVKQTPVKTINTKQRLIIEEGSDEEDKVQVNSNIKKKKKNKKHKESTESNKNGETSHKSKKKKRKSIEVFQEENVDECSTPKKAKKKHKKNKNNGDEVQNISVNEDSSFTVKKKNKKKKKKLNISTEN